MTQPRWLPGELVQATDRVEAELDRPWSLARMADVAGYSPFHFHRLFRDAVGETPVAFVERLRLERAALLLLASETPITHLAWDVGFRNPETFARRFRNRFDVAARDYRAHQLALWSRLGLHAGVDPLDGPGGIEVERLPALAVRVRRRIGEDEAFHLDTGGVGLTLDWPGITEPGRVRQDEGTVLRNGASDPADAAATPDAMQQALTGSASGDDQQAPTGSASRDDKPAVKRTIGNGLHATLRVPAGEPVPATAFQRLYVWAMAGRYRLRPGAILELRQEEDVLVCLPVRDIEER